MKTLIAAVAGFAALTAVAAPAAAQPYGQGRHDGWNINQRQEQLDRRIDRGLRTGDLSRREASRLRDHFRDIARLEARYRVNGLTMRERADLDRRFDRLQAQIRVERRDGDNRRG